MVLTGDIGGTNCRYALFDGTKLSHIRVWPTAESTGVVYDLERYQRDISVSFTHACVAIAGPVTDSSVSLTNANWTGELSDFPCPAIWVNDLLAAIQGLDIAQAEQIWGAETESRPDTLRVAIGVGTGFGQALRIADQAFPAEGGHASFAPNTPLEKELYDFLLTRLSRVRVEDVCSGMGMENILDFLSYKHKVPIAREASAGALLGMHTKDPILTQGLEIFLSIFGSVIGDTALRQMPSGGIWLCGGVSQKMKPHYNSEHFLRALMRKEPMNTQVASIPVYVVLEEELGLLGAGRIATHKLCGFSEH
jgi:glucokinase